MLELIKLSCSLGKRPILRDVSLNAKDGELLVLLGKNGSGKTTLLNCVLGRLPYRGQIRENGVQLASLSPAARAQRVGLLPQTLPQPHIKASELLLFGRNPYMGVTGIAGRADREAVERAIETAQLAPFTDRYVDSLSGGERQRCFFGMLLAQDPQLLLLDEPTANLDTEYRELLYRDLQAQKEAGKTVVTVMHHLSEACRIADRICVLHEGRVRFLGTPTDFFDSPTVAEVFSLRVYACPNENGETLHFFSAR